MIPTNADRADFTAPPTAAQIERQIRWEAASIEAGIKLCREEPANPALTPRRYLAGPTDHPRDRGGVCSLAYRRARGDQDRPGVKPRSAAGLDVPDTAPASRASEYLAFLTLRSIMFERPTAGTCTSRTLTSCARTLAAAIEQELTQRICADGS
jgi:hypothetical protein